MGHSRTSPQRLAAVEKQAAALELRKSGMTFRMIAQRVGYAHASAAHKAIRAGIKKILTEPGEEVIRLECERLDSLLAAVWERALSGDFQAMDRVLKIMERRARLLGLDGSTLVNVEVSANCQTVNQTLHQHGVSERQQAERDQHTAGVLRILFECGAFDELIRVRIQQAPEILEMPLPNLDKVQVPI